jgi:hypothetical protein
MDFSDRELKVLLQALYRFRGEVSGATQAERAKAELVASAIARIESEAGPLRAEKTLFDREMEENLAVLKTGRAGAARARKASSAEGGAAELDNGPASPKVKASAARGAAKASPRSASTKAAAPKSAKAKAKKASGPAKASARGRGASKAKS